MLFRRVEGRAEAWVGVRGMAMVCRGVSWCGVWRVSWCLRRDVTVLIKAHVLILKKWWCLIRSRQSRGPLWMSESFGGRCTSFQLESLKLFDAFQSVDVSARYVMCSEVRGRDTQ